jgi:hypothetical protein
MKIRSRFHRPNAPVSLPNNGKPDTVYYFKPSDPTNPFSPHVCDVTNKTHAQRLLIIDYGNAYFIHDEDAPADAVPIDLPAPPRPAATGELAKGTAADLKAEGDRQPEPTTGLPPVSGDTLEGKPLDVNELLAKPIKDFKAALKTVSKGEATEALEIEKAKPDDAQRPTVIKALEERIAAKG